MRLYTQFAYKFVVLRGRSHLGSGMVKCYLNSPGQRKLNALHTDTTFQDRNDGQST